MIVRDVRKGSFRVDDAFVDAYARIVGPMATLVYVALCRRANREQEAWPSIERIAVEMGIVARSVRRGVKKLEEHGIIGVIRGRDDKQRRAVNVYVLLDKSNWSQRTISPLAPGDSESTSQGTEPGDSGALEGNTRKETQMKERKKSGDKSGPTPIRTTLDDIRRDLEAKGVLRPKPSRP